MLLKSAHRQTIRSSLYENLHDLEPVGMTKFLQAFCCFGNVHSGLIPQTQSFVKNISIIIEINYRLLNASISAAILF